MLSIRACVAMALVVSLASGCTPIQSLLSRMHLGARHPPGSPLSLETIRTMWMGKTIENVTDSWGEATLAFSLEDSITVLAYDVPSRRLVFVWARSNGTIYDCTDTNDFDRIQSRARAAAGAEVVFDEYRSEGGAWWVKVSNIGVHGANNVRISTVGCSELDTLLTDIIDHLPAGEAGLARAATPLDPCVNPRLVRIRWDGRRGGEVSEGARQSLLKGVIESATIARQAEKERAAEKEREEEARRLRREQNKHILR